MASFNILSVQVVNKSVASQYCRACACEIKNSPCEIDNNPARPELPLLLKRYVPEFDVKVTNGCLCTDCVSVLYSFHNFKRKCLRVEEDLRLHLRKHPDVESVELNKVFAPEEQGKKELKKPGNTSETALNTKGSLDNRERKQFDCNQCNRTFPSKYLLDLHLKYHKRPDSNSFVCKLCNFVYQSYRGLQQHTISKHKSDKEKPYGCKICNKRFVDKCKLEAHTRIHTGEKPYKCKMCQYAGRTKTCIARHNKTCMTRHLDMFTCAILPNVIETFR